MMTCHIQKDQICYNTIFSMHLQQMRFSPSAQKPNKTETTSVINHSKSSQDSIHEKPYSTKKEIRKEKNRLAAQKSRDRKQSYLELLQRENKSLKDIISCCEMCTAKAHQWKTTAESRVKTNFPQQPEKREQSFSSSELPLIDFVKQNMNEENAYLRREQESSQYVSKFLWFCLITAMICLAQLNNQQSTSIRLGLEINKTQIMGEKLEKANVAQQMQKSLMNAQSKQCMKCMECLKNMTNITSNGLIPLTTENSSNSTRNNTNNTNKILFCKSKAAFFKKVYNALSNSSPFTRKNVGKVQAHGKALSQFLDKECFADSPLDENQLYSVEFTVAIMQLVAVNQSKAHAFRNISVE